MKVVVLEDFFLDILECFRSVKEDSLWYDDTCATTDLEHLGNMLEKEHLGCSCWKYEILLDLRLFFATKWGICEDDIISVVLLNISDIGRESIGFAKVRIMDPMKNHIHHTEDVGEWCLLIAVKGIIGEK